MKKWIMIIFSSLLLIVLAAIIWEWFYLKTTTKQEVYILPQGFKGIVLIAYDQEDGVENLKEGGKLIYKIPNSGVLKIKEKSASTLSQSWYYFEDAQGKRTILDYCFPPCEEMKRDTNKVFAFARSSGGFENNSKTIITRTFFVGAEKDRDSLSKLNDKLNPFELIRTRK